MIGYGRSVQGLVVVTGARRTTGAHDAASASEVIQKGHHGRFDFRDIIYCILFHGNVCEAVQKLQPTRSEVAGNSVPQQ